MHLWWENKVGGVSVEGWQGIGVGGYQRERKLPSHKRDGLTYCTPLTELLSNCSPRLSRWFKFRQTVFRGVHFIIRWRSLPSSRKAWGGGTCQFLRLEITFKLLFINRGTVELRKSHQCLNRSEENPEWGWRKSCEGGKKAKVVMGNELAVSDAHHSSPSLYTSTQGRFLAPGGCRSTWSWNMAPPKAQTAAKTK